jgi:hypothetical protein
MILTNVQSRLRIRTVKKITKSMRFIRERFDATIAGIPRIEDFYIGDASPITCGRPSLRQPDPYSVLKIARRRLQIPMPMKWTAGSVV